MAAAFDYARRRLGVTKRICVPCAVLRSREACLRCWDSYKIRVPKSNTVFTVQHALLQTTTVCDRIVHLGGDQSGAHHRLLNPAYWKSGAGGQFIVWSEE